MEAVIVILKQNLPGGTEESHKKPVIISGYQAEM
jgi:hypothetical protein